MTGLKYVALGVMSDKDDVPRTSSCRWILVVQV